MSKYKKGEKCEIILSEEMAKQLNVLHELGFTPENCKLASFHVNSLLLVISQEKLLLSQTEDSLGKRVSS